MYGVNAFPFLKIKFENVAHTVVTASWRRRLNRGPCRGRHVVHCRRRHPGLPHHGPPEAEVRGQVQASLAGVDLSEAAAGQSHQASSRGEAYLKVICDTHLSTWPVIHRFLP